MTDVTVGHTVTNTIVYLDAAGNPMLTAVVPDTGSVVWANTAPATVDTLVVSADGLTAVVSAVGAGSDSLSVMVKVGGVSFSATESLNISAAPQVLTSIAIQGVVS